MTLISTLQIIYIVMDFHNIIESKNSFSLNPKTLSDNRSLKIRNSNTN